MKNNDPYFTALADVRNAVADYPAALAALAAELGRPNDPIAIATELETRASRLAIVDTDLAAVLQSSATQIREASAKTNTALEHALYILAGLATSGEASDAIRSAA